MYYPVIVHKDLDSAYGGTIVDFPGCFTAGDDIEELIKNAQEAVECYMEGEAPEIPIPSTIDKINKSGQAENGMVLLVDIDMSFLDKSPKRLNVSIPTYILRHIDRAAEAAGKTRSGYLVDCAIKEISTKGAR
jgi:predicted RNase H-like HicB family nuclease